MSADPIYRTALSQRSDGGWTLSIDGRTVAETDEPVDPQLAQAWARQHMGEGVTFLNGLVGEPAWSGYWVAGPTETYAEYVARTADADGSPGAYNEPGWWIDPARYSDDNVDAS